MEGGRRGWQHQLPLATTHWAEVSQGKPQQQGRPTTAAPRSVAHLVPPQMVHALLRRAEMWRLLHPPPDHPSLPLVLHRHAEAREESFAPCAAVCSGVCSAARQTPRPLLDRELARRGGSAARERVWAKCCAYLCVALRVTGTVKSVSAMRLMPTSCLWQPVTASGPSTRTLFWSITLMIVHSLPASGP